MTEPITISAVTPRQDGPVLHFLKELPAWVILGMFTGAFLAVWQVSHDDFIPRIIDGLVGALLTSIVAQRPKAAVVPPPTNINADSVNPASMDNATVNAERLNVENKKENADV